jgi:hypothetical protein
LQSRAESSARAREGQTLRGGQHLQDDGHGLQRQAEQQALAALVCKIAQLLPRCDMASPQRRGLVCSSPRLFAERLVLCRQLLDGCVQPAEQGHRGLINAR